MVIPERERFGRLKDFLIQWVDAVAAIKTANPRLAQEWPQFFSFLSYPWILVAATFPNEHKAVLEERKREIVALGFNGDEAKERLQDVLANDRHLHDCCPTLLHLVNFLDGFFITAVADAKRQGASQDRIDFAYSEFESLTYRQGRFKRIALSQLFNFEMEGNSASFAADNSQANIRIESHANTIPGILGESGFQAFLHPIGIGNCFVIDEEGSSAVDDFNWLLEKRQKALIFAQVLQYFQDGVVHIGYSVPFFQPNWANQIRRTGLFFLGEPRRTPYEAAEKMYVVGAAEKERLSRWWKAATTQRIVDYVANKKGKLRLARFRSSDLF